MKDEIMDKKIQKRNKRDEPVIDRIINTWNKYTSIEENKYMKRGATSLVGRKMQIKTLSAEATFTHQTDKN